MVKAAAMATVAMAKAASNISKATEAARKALEHPGDLVHTSPTESVAIGPRTAKRTLWRFLPLCAKTETIRKREDPVTLASAALCPASPNEENTDKDTSLAPPHLKVPVELRKGLSGKGFYPYLAPVDSGATYHFMFQSILDKLGLEAVKAGRSKVKKKAPSPITMVNNGPLHSTRVVRQMVQISESAVTKQSHAINFVVADIANYDMILSMAWF
jgi:hypothetical protein